MLFKTCLPTSATRKSTWSIFFTYTVNANIEETRLCSDQHCKTTWITHLTNITISKHYFPRLMLRLCTLTLASTDYRLLHCSGWTCPAPYAMVFNGSSMKTLQNVLSIAMDNVAICHSPGTRESEPYNLRDEVRKCR